MHTMERVKINLSGKYKVGIVTGRFNSHMTSLLKNGAEKILNEYGVDSISVDVPGAFEAPLAAQWLIKNSNCDAVVVLAIVVRGDTTHYDYVCSAVEKGCMRVQLDSSCPVTFGVLTTENEQQAMDRCGGSHGHKGEEAALVALEMLSLSEQCSQA